MNFFNKNLLICCLMMLSFPCIAGDRKRKFEETTESAKQASAKRQKKDEEATTLLVRAFNQCIEPKLSGEGMKQKVEKLPENLRQHIASFLLPLPIWNPEKQNLKFIIKKLKHLIPAVMSNTKGLYEPVAQRWPWQELHKAHAQDKVHVYQRFGNNRQHFAYPSEDFPVLTNLENCFVVSRLTETESVATSPKKIKLLRALNRDQLEFIISLGDKNAAALAMNNENPVHILSGDEQNVFTSLPEEIQDHLIRNFVLAGSKSTL